MIYDQVRFIGFLTDKDTKYIVSCLRNVIQEMSNYKQTTYFFNINK